MARASAEACDILSHHEEAYQTIGSNYLDFNQVTSIKAKK
jgi:hypothetical protein